MEAAETALDEREAELAVSTKAFERLSAQSAAGSTAGSPAPSLASSIGSPEKRSGIAFLLSDMQEGERALADARKAAAMWRRMYEEIQPASESAAEAQRQLSALRSRLEMADKETARRIDLLTLELETCKADRDLAERECAAAIGDNAAIRSRLATELQKSGGSASSLSSLRSGVSGADAALCRVTFSLEGASVPGRDVSISVVGSDPVLGSWDLSARQPLRPTRAADGQIIWKCQVLVSPGAALEYKFVAETPAGEVRWESGENRTVDLAGAGNVANVSGRWRGAQ
jgi:Starch binding domain